MSTIIRLDRNTYMNLDTNIIYEFTGNGSASEMCYSRDAGKPHISRQAFCSGNKAEAMRVCLDDLAQIGAPL